MARRAERQKKEQVGEDIKQQDGRLIYNHTCNLLNEMIYTRIERQRLSDWIKQQDPTILVCCLQETHFKYKDMDRLKVKG